MVKSKKKQEKSKPLSPKSSGSKVSRTEELFKHGKHADLLSKLQPMLKNEMAYILEHEDKIVKLLGTQQKRTLLIKDPNKFFKEAKINLRPAIRKRLESFQYDALLMGRRFLLPNGQSILPNISIHIKTE